MNLIKNQKYSINILIWIKLFCLQTNESVEKPLLLFFSGKLIMHILMFFFLFIYRRNDLKYRVNWHRMSAGRISFHSVIIVPLKRTNERKKEKRMSLVRLLSNRTSVFSFYVPVEWVTMATTAAAMVVCNCATNFTFFNRKWTRHYNTYQYKTV